MRLRPYQTRAADAAITALARRRNPLVVSPPGSGKSFVLAEVARRIVSSGGRVVVLAHRREILRQLRDAALEIGVPDEDIGRLFPGGDRRRSVLTIASQPMLARCRDLKPTDVVLVDEAHRAPARTYRDVVERLSPAVVGFTATPFRLDGRSLGAIFDVSVVAASAGELVREGFLGDPVCYVADEEFQPDVRDLRVVRGDYPRVELTERVVPRRIVGEVVRRFVELTPGDSTGIVFATSLTHARELVRRFTSAGVPAKVIEGRTPIAERDLLLDRLRSRELRVAVNVGVLSEGFDFPEVDAVVLARPTASAALYIQQVGRAMRPRSDDRRTVVLDHARNVLRFDLPTAPRTFSLSTGVVQSDPVRLPRRCRFCSAAVGSDVDDCPVCGADLRLEPRVPAEDDVGLVVLDSVRVEGIRSRLGRFLSVRGIQNDEWIEAMIANWGDRATH